MNMRVLAGALLASCCAFGAQAGFLQFPLRCSDPGTPCPASSINYTIHGAYTANSMNSILDHSMFLNPSSNYYPYGVTQTSATGGDGIVEAFNGEKASQPRLYSDFRCVGGNIYIHPDWDRTQRLTNTFGCPANYASYDEHPGYDYKASLGTPVYAAATGTVISTICYTANLGAGSCDDWGALAVNAGNGYFYQYLHMDTHIPVSPGQTITVGQQVGTVGGRCGPGCTFGPHLHFEVRHIGPKIGAEVYPIVDPYGWVGGGTDPLYSAPYVAPANLWQ